MLRLAARRLWQVLLLGIILLGVLVSVGRLLTPALNNFKADIEQKTGELLGAQVSIENINARWHGFGPSLSLKKVTIAAADTQSPPLRLKRIDLDLSLKQLLRHGHFLPWNIVLYDTQLQLLRNTDGTIQVSGLGSESGDTDNSGLLSLLSLRRVQLVNAGIQWHDVSGTWPDTDLQRLNLLLRNDGKRHQLDIQLQLPGQPAQSLRMAADVFLQDNNLQTWQGDVYLETQNFNIAPWLKNLVSEKLGLQLLQASTDSRIWLKRDQQQISRISGLSNWRQLKLTNPASGNTLSSKQLQMDFRWRRHDQGWQLDIARLAANINDWPAQATGLSVLVEGTQQEQQIRAAVQQLEASLLQQLAPLLPASEQHIETLQLSGLIKQLKLYWSAQQTTPDWYIEGQLQNFSLAPPAEISETIPGVSNLSASFMALPEQGVIDIDSVDSQYLQPQMFRWPIDLQVLKGQVGWHRQDHQWILRSTALEAVTPHLSTMTRLLLQFPDDGEPIADIQTDFHDGDGSHAKIYYPIGIMGEHLVDWLDRSVISGRVTSGSFILKGPLADFAYSKKHNGHFEVMFNVEDLILDYFQDWPRLEEVAAQVRFHNNSLGIQLVSGKLFNTDIGASTAFIDSLDPISSVKIDANASGPLSDILSVLSESPLKKDFGRFAGSMRGNGDAHTHLSFVIPLNEKGQYQLDGQVEFINDALHLSDWDLVLEHVNGRLGFTLDGLESDKLTAQLLGNTSAVDIKHDARGNTAISTNIHLRDSQIEKLTGIKLTNIAAGESDWQIKLQIPPVSSKQNQAIKLDLLSNLQDMRIDAPEPFNKPAGLQRSLLIKTQLENAGKLPIGIQFGDDIHASLQLGSDSKGRHFLKSGHVHFGGKPADKATHSDSLLVTGHIKNIDLDDWLNWLDTLPVTPGNKGLSGQINITGNKVSFHNFSFQNYVFQLQNRKPGYQGYIESKQLAGSFSIDDAEKMNSINVDLDRIEVALDPEKWAANSGKVELKNFDPGSIPDLHININRLLVNQGDFGKAHIYTSRGPHSMHLKSLQVDSDYVTLDASADWQKKNGSHVSSMKFNLKSPDFGKLLTTLGYTPQMDGGKARIDGDVWWQGGPSEFNQETLSGKLDLDISKGRFLEFEPGVGRVLGVLNIAALQRRLTLDFSDLFKEGFSFDGISAAFTLDSGDAYTNNLLIESPSATINLSGRTGLKSRDYDQLVTVTPSLQSTITIAGAVAGGPAGAAVAYLAQKLIGKQVDKIARTRYSITGSWENPEVTTIKQNQTENATDSKR